MIAGAAVLLSVITLSSPLAFAEIYCTAWEEDENGEEYCVCWSDDVAMREWCE